MKCKVRMFILAKLLLLINFAAVSSNEKSKENTYVITKEQIENHHQLLAKDVIAILKMNLPLPTGKESYEHVKVQISNSKATIDKISNEKIEVKFDIDTYDNGKFDKYLLRYNFEDGIYVNGPMVIEQ